MPAKTPKGRETMATKAYHRIKTRLLRGEYMPGQFLQLHDISYSLGLGRTPVHQALHQLGQEGLLEIIPRKGILVRSESLDDIRQALELRMLIEPYCASQCAELGDAEVHAKLKDCLRRQMELGEAPANEELMPLDREMHSLIAKGVQNSLIAGILQPIHERMTRTWLMPHWHEADYNQTIGEHRAIIDAILARDGPAADLAMRNHIKSIRLRMGLR